jgi:uncharacterized membrane protein (UPF0127 family)
VSAGARAAQRAGRVRRAAWLASGALILLVALVALVAWQASDDGSPEASTNDASSFVFDVTNAQSPYIGYSAGSLRVGNQTLAVVVADDDGERIQGLRGRSDAAPYDGMLFVWPEDTTSAFTMAGVPGQLDIGFYDASGKRIGRLVMEPCPSGTDATCPIHRIDQPFRFALETAGGQLPAGSLGQP